MSEGPKRSVSLWQSRNAVHAASAGQVTQSRLKAAIGPTVAVSGSASRLNNGIDVDQVRLKPAGAKMSLLMNGLR